MKADLANLEGPGMNPSGLELPPRSRTAKDAGIDPSAEEITDGMAEFAQRGNLSLEQFIGVLGQNGVDEQTFRDFVTAGLSWRQLVQVRFQARATVSDEEVDRALSGSGTGSNVRVLLSEIIIPIRPGTEAQVQSLAERISRYRSTAEFSAASPARPSSSWPCRQDRPIP